MVTREVRFSAVDGRAKRNDGAEMRARLFVGSDVEVESEVLLSFLFLLIRVDKVSE